MIWRRTLLAAGLAFCAVHAFAGPQHVERAERPQPRGKLYTAAPEDRIAQLIARSGVTGQSTAVLIDMASGQVLAAYDADRAMPPASVTKVATTLFAIDKLGPSFRFTTRVLATGPVSGGRVQGDLILVGGGDPALDSDEMVAMIKQMRDRGISGATGRYLFYADGLPNLRQIDEGQPLNAGYNPGISGLNLNFNRVYFE